MNRLIIINDALIGTGNNPINVEYDGTDLWIAADSAYRRAVGYLTTQHNWKFATTTARLAGRLPVSPHPRFLNAYELPADCLHVESAFVGSHSLTKYEILDGKLCCDHDQKVTLKYTRLQRPDLWPPGFLECVTMKVEEYLFRGLNEDGASATDRFRMVEAKIAELKTATDQQEPARAIFRSRSAARRAGGPRRTRFDRPPYDGVE